MAPGAHGVRVRGGGRAPRLRHLHDVAELLRARGEEVHGALAVVGAVSLLPESQLGPLVPLANPGRQQVEAAVAAELDVLHGEPGLLAVGALEEVPRGVLLDAAHGVRLAAAGLPEHEHRADPAVEGAAHELRARGPVDFGRLGALVEHPVEVEGAVGDEGRLQVGLEEAVVQHDLRRPRPPRHDGGHVVVASLLLLLLEYRPLPEEDLHGRLLRGRLHILLAALRRPAPLVPPLADGVDEEVAVVRAQGVLVEHLPRALLAIVAAAAGTQGLRPRLCLLLLLPRPGRVDRRLRGTPAATSGSIRFQGRQPDTLLWVWLAAGASTPPVE
mmetsp:Transcript_91442/g.284442  ORF Transcript_91442/g.284442 Transcript_91442/m.284442 type:complete len:329 (+) Transcript_91442:729-1715(+)